MTSSPMGDARRHPRGLATVTLTTLAPAILALTTLAALAACTGSQATSSPTTNPLSAGCESGAPYTLRVLATSPLSDMVPVLDQVTRETGVTVQLPRQPIGSLVGAQEVIDGTADGTYDAVWFDSDNYLNLWPDGLAKLNGTTEIMSSPVILGLRSSVARRLGWDLKSPTWTAIATAAMHHEFTFGMTDPATSNSGLSALVAVATAVAGKGGALQPAEIPSAEPELTGLFHAQVLTAPSSGQLTQKYAALQSAGTAQPDGLFDYESKLITLQAQAPRDDPLTLVYPADGVLDATYPLSVLASASPDAKSAYQRLAACLTSTAIQRQIMAVTHRRPISGNPPLTGDLAAHRPFELLFPATSSAVQDLITAYHGTLRTAGRTIYVLDVSGSMRGARLAGLQQALAALCGINATLAGRLTMFRADEQVTFLPFGTTPGNPVTFDLPQADDEAVLQQMRAYITGLRVQGHTAIYDALVSAYQIMATQNAADPGRISSIVLLTDGGNNTGRNLASFINYYHSLPQGSPPVYTIAFGEADLQALTEVASVTGGTAFDATSQPVSALSTIFEEIRGYQ